MRGRAAACCGRENDANNAIVKYGGGETSSDPLPESSTRKAAKRAREAILNMSPHKKSRKMTVQATMDNTGFDVHVTARTVTD